MAGGFHFDLLCSFNDSENGDCNKDVGKGVKDSYKCKYILQLMFNSVNRIASNHYNSN